MMQLLVPALKLVHADEHDYSRVDLRLLPTGLHIYVNRGAYSHHGIYIGDEKVIHFLGPKADGPIIPCKKCGFRRNMGNGGVVETCLECFLRGGSLSVYRYGKSEGFLQIIYHVHCPMCISLEAKPSWEVVETAKQKLKEGFGTYNLISNNCEHFATFCMTGYSFCQQGPANALELLARPPTRNTIFPSFRLFGS